MPKKLGLDFAPLNISMERRLQTLAVISFYGVIVLSGPLAVGMLLWLLFTKYYWLTCLYITWYWYDRNTPFRGGRKWRFMRHWTAWNYFRDYFPIKLIKTADLDPDRNYIFATHPHGAIIAGMSLNAGTEATGFSQLFPGLRPTILSLDIQHWAPFLREFQLWGGACSASRASIEWLLTKEGTGNALFLVPGGMKEVVTARPGTCDLYLKRRKGFCRLALKHGADLVPVLSFGENELFNEFKPKEGSFSKVLHELFIRYLGFPLAIIHGRGIFQYTFGPVPFRRPVTTVVGRPLPVTKLDSEPTKEQIDELHTKYCKILRELYDQEKTKHGLDHVSVVIN
ncbi:2-acylglycerol O-acyltransferase 1 [Halotydeus destructor]|nr:2-acylglycerol O-acyltransferase 1 [Halotydeus destructor]